MGYTEFTQLEIIPWRKTVKKILHEYTELLIPSILD